MVEVYFLPMRPYLDTFPLYLYFLLGIDYNDIKRSFVVNNIQEKQRQQLFVSIPSPKMNMHIS